MNFSYFFSRVFRLKRQKVLQQQETNSVKRKIMKLILSFFPFLQSLNGVWLNRERLEPLKVYSIHKGDHIQLGVPLENKENAEYEYEVTEEDWERMYPCLAPKNDQIIGKNRGLRTKRKFSLDELEGPGAEGPSHLKSKISKVSYKPGQPVKSHGKGEVASQPSEYLDPKLTSLELSEKATDAHVYPSSTKVVALHHKKQKASSPSASQSSLELFKVTMSRILKLKTQMQEKQVAVLNVKRQTQKGNSKKIVKMEKELQDLQSQLCAEQAQQQARVEQLEKTFQEEEQHLQVPHMREGHQCSSGVGGPLVSLWPQLTVSVLETTC